MTEVNTTSRTQRIIVDPASYAVSIIYAGQIGPVGRQGPPGQSSSSQFQYRWKTDTTSSDPGHGFIKANINILTAATQVYVSIYDRNDQAVLLLSQLVVNDKFALYEAGDLSRWNEYIITSPMTLMASSWYSIPVSYVRSGSLPFNPNNNADIMLFIQKEAAAPVNDLAYRHVQSTAATVWNITHGLTFRPNVTIVDSSGREVVAEITYISDTDIQIVFSAAVGGEAYLS